MCRASLCPKWAGPTPASDVVPEGLREPGLARLSLGRNSGRASNWTACCVQDPPVCAALCSCRRAADIDHCAWLAAGTCRHPAAERHTAGQPWPDLTPQPSPGAWGSSALSAPHLARDDGLTPVLDRDVLDDDALCAAGPEALEGKHSLVVGGHCASHGGREAGR
jgi:hypothetical protein